MIIGVLYDGQHGNFVMFGKIGLGVGGLWGRRKGAGMVYGRVG